MIDKPRFVIDTNVLIDATCFEDFYGFRAYLLAQMLGTIMVSPATFAEFEEVLTRPRFDRYLSTEERLMFLSILRRDVSWLLPWCHYHVCRDQTDDKFIDLAVCSGATRIVTRDADLLALGTVNGITIQDARSFWTIQKRPRSELDTGEHPCT